MISVQGRRLFGAMLGGVALAACAWAAPIEKKIVEFGWDVPDTAYLREHVRDMERLPFNGVVLRMYGTRDGDKVDGYTVFRREAWQRDWFAQCAEDLRATDFRTFTDNFILMWTTPGTPDWFSDDDWRAVCNNIGILAWVAREGGVKGICFDPEPYGEHTPWAYEEQPRAGEYTFDQYRAQARKRGAEFMRAIASEYPDITILMLFGGSIVGGALAQADPVEELATEGYGLLPFFIDGMLDALPDDALIVDGCEPGYYMEERVAFLEAYRRMKQQVLAVISPENWDKYQTQVLAGFGLYPDRAWRDAGWGWHVDDPSRNYYTPEEFKENLTNAVDVADRYVWVYTEALNWWTGKDVPPGYEEAIREVQQEPWRLRLAGLVARHQAPAELLVTYVPLEWTFRKDDEGHGAAEGWHKLDYDDSSWETVRTDSQWCNQEAYQDMIGNGWGRVWFDVPASAAGKRLYLIVGALDEYGDIYVNGALVHERRPTVPSGWRLPFIVEVTDAMHPGERNLLAVHAMAETTLGGVWKPSAVLADVLAEVD
ncbi:MAG: hypothetical protein JSV65_05910 [Armatimonadota bacterium]|nr:MAG: hypothetical protein JSV65_05910 [Armatimonadota bacterium]